MPRSVILDTNVLLFDPEAPFAFPEDNVFIPFAVIKEVDHFKHDQTETGRAARQIIALIDQLRNQGPLRFGVKLKGNASLTVVPDDPEALPHQRSTHARIIALAKNMAQCHDPDSILIVTKDVSLRLQADNAGIPAQDFAPHPTTSTETLKGWHLVNAESPDLECLRAGRPLTPAASIPWKPHEYAILRNRENHKDVDFAKFKEDDGRLWPLLTSEPKACGIKPRNVEQLFAMDALLDESISLVTLAGNAGTGKTLLAIAAALHQIFAEGKYRKLLIFRPTMPVSRDLGYLPGDLGEKMKPWMQPVYDALDFIRLQDRKSTARSLPDDLLTCPEISVEPLTYIRGRSIPNQFIIIDEAQNLTPLEVKTAVTRCGNGSKIVLTGDPEQIDNPYVDATSNGLTRLVDQFLPSPLSAHITLFKGERSLLAETAAKLL